MLRKICLVGALIVVAVSFGASSASAARCPKGHHHPSGSSFFGDGFSDGRASVDPGSDGFSDGRA